MFWFICAHVECRQPLIGRFYTRGRIIRLEELGQTFVVHVVMRLKYTDGHKKHYASGQTFLRNAS